MIPAVRIWPLIPILLSLSCASSVSRHQRVAQRRAGPAIICHRGAHEFAHENTLEAYRATFELGGDGNEIDIRQTRDGILVLFHDDMLDVNLKAFGDISDYTYDELQKFHFRNPGPFGRACRIPTLKQVFELHQKYAGLIHLDIKVPDIDAKIAQLLDDMDMWDHVSNVSDYNSAVIRANPKLHPRPYKAGLYEDHSEVFPDSITTALAKPGQDLICNDPRGTVIALNRKLAKPSTHPLLPPLNPAQNPTIPPIADLLTSIRSSDPSPQAITARAHAADQLLLHSDALVGSASADDVFSTLEFRIHHRTLHPNWRYHALDGAIALRTLILLRAPHALDLSREFLYLDDPALIPLNNPQYKVPHSWVDFRIKNVILPALEKLPGPQTKKLCRDYLALSDEQARKIGPPQFEPAAHTLLIISPHTQTALELLHHRLPLVRGRAILDCLSHSNEQWALAALRQAAPHALAYIPPQ
ncbi:MAG TPA: glycerophosphodiester phosphodiesterase family protein [Tepidisphaeraceae bacterium]|jgi:hypothetical protein|nr:glycerophosphodiester phosphodiesterase family protein [Tepidisphaeraceae bacterium]